MREIFIGATMLLTGCINGRVGTGIVWREDLQCWDGEKHPNVHYTGDMQVMRVDDLGQCWILNSTEVPRGWEDPPLTVEEACPEGGRENPSCYVLLGYEP